MADDIKMTDNIKQKLISYCEEKFPQYIKILEEMVAINSFTGNKAGVNSLGEYTASLFAPLGFAFDFVPSVNPSYGSHLVCVKEGTGSGSIALISHLDTVFTEEEERRNNFHFHIEGDRVYGPGTCDIKGGTLVMYMMLDALKKNAPDFFDSISWYLMFDASEETDSADFGLFCKERIPKDAAAALVFEAGGIAGDELHIITSRKGRAVLHIEAYGRGAHAGTSHHDGLNAIVNLCGAVTSMAELTDYTRGVTVNTGIIEGGSGLNRVPEYAYADMEMRAFDPDVFNETIDKIKLFALDDGASKLSIELVRSVLPWPENPGSLYLKEIWNDAAHEMGLKAVPIRRGGLSDGNLLWDALPVIDALGPTGSNAHCSERSADGQKDYEFAFLPSFVPKAVINGLAIIRLFNDKK